MIKSNKKNILIAGGAGFIGSHLCDFFIKKGYYVICVDNFITGTKDNIYHLLNNKNFKFIEHDITDYLNVKEDLDYVLNFASPASPVYYLKYPIETLRVGSLGTENTLQLALKKNAVFFLASTSEIYGDPLMHPQKETYWGNVNSIGPRAVYDEAKRYAEAITFAYHRYYNVDIRVIRIFNTFGPRMQIDDGRIVPTFIDQALKGKSLTIFGNGKQTRSFCYVSDLVDGIYKMMRSREIGPVNLGNPYELTVLEFANIIKVFTGSKSKIIFYPLPQDDPKMRKPDITKAKKILKWSPKVSMKDGISRTVNWFKEQGGIL
ncbi:MAG: SDR family oxidoreductase [bacterium]|nr:SDR family oxidoreductase [bacterium]